MADHFIHIELGNTPSLTLSVCQYQAFPRRTQSVSDGVLPYLPRHNVKHGMALATPTDAHRVSL